jgi:hypothetical protein
MKRSVGERQHPLGKAQPNAGHVDHTDDEADRGDDDHQDRRGAPGVDQRRPPAPRVAEGGKERQT